MTEPAIEIHELSKLYRLGAGVQGDLRDTVAALGRRLLGREAPAVAGRELWALRDIDLTVNSGESVGLIGHNGAGKSTLLKILSRITQPTSGRARILGRTGSLLEVGTGFHPELTGRENIFLNGTILGMRRAEIASKLDAIVTFSEIERFIDTPAKRYSSGMYVRLAFSVAAHLDLDVLLMDEVLAVGDIAFQQKCLGKMGDVVDEGRTVVFVSHNMTAIQQLCTRGIVLAEGQVRADAPVQEAINTYLRGTSEQRGEKRFEVDSAPGDEHFRLRAVRLRVDDQTSDTVPIDRPVEVEVEFEALRPFRAATPLVYLLDGSGNTVLSSGHFPGANTQTDDWIGTHHEPRTYRSKCVIPGNFLNDGRYYVSVYMLTFELGTIHFHVPQAVSLDVFDTGTMRKVGSYGEWHGVVRVPLEWRTEAVEAPRALEFETASPGTDSGS